MQFPVVRNITLFLGIALLLAHASVVEAQIVRSPRLNMQYHRAETAWRSGASVLEAKARVDRVLEELPDDVEALKLRAQVLIAMDRPLEALDDARRAVALDAKDGEAHLIVCEAARLSGQPHLAIRALDVAAELLLEDAALHVRMSWNAVLLGQLDKAEAFARIAKALDPDDATGYYQLARVFILKEQVDDAATIIAKGLNTSVLDPGVIQADSILVQIANHPVVMPLLDD